MMATTLVVIMAIVAGACTRQTMRHRHDDGI
jgi:hypothetical protein